MNSCTNVQHLKAPLTETWCTCAHSIPLVQDTEGMQFNYYQHSTRLCLSSCPLMFPFHRVENQDRALPRNSISSAILFLDLLPTPTSHISTSDPASHSALHYGCPAGRCSARIMEKAQAVPCVTAKVTHRHKKKLGLLSKQPDACLNQNDVSSNLQPLWSDLRSNL